MDDQKINLEDLRARLHQYQPVPYVEKNMGFTIIDMWHVLDQLLNVIEAQDVRIKALEDRSGRDDAPGFKRPVIMPPLPEE